jgi:hypothetical protein
LSSLISLNAYSYEQLKLLFPESTIKPKLELRMRGCYFEDYINNNRRIEELSEMSLRQGRLPEVTSKLLEEAASNSQRGEVVMQMLREQSSKEVEIMPNVVAAAWRNDESGERVMRLLLTGDNNEIKMMEGTAEMVAFDASVWGCVLFQARSN